MGFWKDLKQVFSGKNLNQAFKERMQKEKQEKLEIQDKQGVRDSIFKSKDFFSKQIEKTQNYINEIKKEYTEIKRKEPDFDFSGFFDDLNIEFLRLVNAK